MLLALADMRNSKRGPARKQVRRSAASTPFSQASAAHVRSHLEEASPVTVWTDGLAEWRSHASQGTHTHTHTHTHKPGASPPLATSAANKGTPPALSPVNTVCIASHRRDRSASSASRNNTTIWYGTESCSKAAVVSKIVAHVLEGRQRDGRDCITISISHHIISKHSRLVMRITTIWWPTHQRQALPCIIVIAAEEGFGNFVCAGPFDKMIHYIFGSVSINHSSWLDVRAWLLRGFCLLQNLLQSKHLCSRRVRRSPELP